jgi:hypothetical protein
MPELSPKDLERLCRLVAAGDAGLAVAHAHRGRWVFAFKRKLARWGSMPPRNVAGHLLYPRRIYATDLGRTLAELCP